MFSHSIVSDSLQPHGLQHARLPSLSLSPGVCSNSCPLSHWRHSVISSSVTPFSMCNWITLFYTWKTVNQLFFNKQLKKAAAAAGGSYLPWRQLLSSDKEHLRDNYNDFTSKLIYPHTLISLNTFWQPQKKGILKHDWVWISCHPGKYRLRPPSDLI